MNNGAYVWTYIFLQCQPIPQCVSWSPVTRSSVTAHSLLMSSVWLVMQLIMSSQYSAKVFKCENDKSRTTEVYIGPLQDNIYNVMWLSLIICRLDTIFIWYVCQLLQSNIVLYNISKNFTLSSLVDLFTPNSLDSIQKWCTTVSWSHNSSTVYSQALF